MRAIAALLLCLCGLAVAQQPAPRPIGWPSDFCRAEGVNALNPLCGTCSTMIAVQTEGVGTAILWQCKGPDGVWLTQGLVRPWLTPMVQPSVADFAAKGFFGALWDANTQAATPDSDAKYSAAWAKGVQYLANVPRPADPPPPAAVAWIVATVSTGQRPSYVLQGSQVVREGSQFVPVTTQGKPTPCDCDGPGNTVQFGTQKLCAVRGYTTAIGAKRYSVCAQPK
jgi:hypothetical protein